MNKALIIFFLIFLLFSQFLQASNLADNFERFEKTVKMAISRIEFILDNDVDPTAIKPLIIRHVELAAIANSCISQNEEDFYHLAVYLVASYFRQTKLALDVMNHELEQTNHRPLERWLKIRVNELEKGNIPMTDVSAELTSLTKILNITK